MCGAREKARDTRRVARDARRRCQAYRGCKIIYICVMSRNNRVFMHRYVFLNAWSLKSLFRTPLYMFIRRHALGYTMDFCMYSAGTQQGAVHQRLHTEDDELAKNKIHIHEDS